MRLSQLALSSLIYIFGFLFLMASNPKLFEISDNISSEKCFMMFFIAGVSAVFIFHMVSSLYD